MFFKFVGILQTRPLRLWLFVLYMSVLLRGGSLYRVLDYGYLVPKLKSDVTWVHT